MREDLKPQDQYEEACFSRIMHSTWRLDLSQAAENRALFDFMNAPESGDLQKRYERFAKYRRQYERSLPTALRDLRVSQENRLIQRAITLPPNAVLAPTLHFRALLRDFKKFQNELPQAISMTAIGSTLFEDKKLDQLMKAAESRRIEQNNRTADAYWGPIDPTRTKSAKTRAA